VARLIEKTACDGLLPVSAGRMDLVEIGPLRITSVAPFAGEEAAAAAALETMGLGWPRPNRATAAGETACLFTGRAQAFLIGADPAGLRGKAALTDQSDAWAAMELRGPGVEAVLARLVAADLREKGFPPGSAIRSGLGHMMSVLWRVAPDRVRILVFRSMAATAVHELHVAMKAVAARAAV
jgi:heterotetrameric sarcosine oxidase gamma subunit